MKQAASSPSGPASHHIICSVMNEGGWMAEAFSCNVPFSEERSSLARALTRGHRHTERHGGDSTVVYNSPARYSPPWERVERYV